MSNTIIHHQGVVQNIDSQYIYVSILAVSACSSCHSKSMCHLSDMKEKVIHIPVNNQTYTVGEHVNVIMKESLGMYAVLLSYILPLILFIVTMVISINIYKSEPLAGLLGLLTLIIYYIILYMFRSKLRRQFSFSIQKIEKN